MCENRNIISFSDIIYIKVNHWRREIFNIYFITIYFCERKVVKIDIKVLLSVICVMFLSSHYYYMALYG